MPKHGRDPGGHLKIMRTEDVPRRKRGNIALKRFADEDGDERPAPHCSQHIGRADHAAAVISNVDPTPKASDDVTDRDCPDQIRGDNDNGEFPEVHSSAVERPIACDGLIPCSETPALSPFPRTRNACARSSRYIAGMRSVSGSRRWRRRQMSAVAPPPAWHI